MPTGEYIQYLHLSLSMETQSKDAAPKEENWLSEVCFQNFFLQCQLECSKERIINLLCAQNFPKN